MIQMQVTGPRGSVLGQPKRDKRAARASALGSYSKTFGREALKQAKGKLKFDVVHGNPAPVPTPASAPAPASASRKRSGTRSKRSSSPAPAADLPFKIDRAYLKEGAYLVLGLDRAGRPIYAEGARNLTDARATARSAALPKAAKYRLALQVVRHPGVFET